MSIRKADLRVSKDSNQADLPERTLWCNVIRHAVARAQGTGEAPAMQFFRSEHFELLCFYLKLDAESIRQKVLSTGFSTLNSKRVYKSVTKRSNS